MEDAGALDQLLGTTQENQTLFDRLQQTLVRLQQEQETIQETIIIPVRLSPERNAEAEPNAEAERNAEAAEPNAEAERNEEPEPNAEAGRNFQDAPWNVIMRPTAKSAAKSAAANSSAASSSGKGKDKGTGKTGDAEGKGEGKGTGKTGDAEGKGGKESEPRRRGERRGKNVGWHAEMHKAKAQGKQVLQAWMKQNPYPGKKSSSSSSIK